MATVGRPPREFHEYLISPTRDSHISHDEYLLSPASAVLKYTVEAKSAIDICIRRFKNESNQMTPDAKDALQHIITAILPAIMGHFETYQRYFFAGIFELSPYLKDFDAQSFFKSLDKKAKVTIDPMRLAAYRGQGASSIGVLLADALPGWHSPSRVNDYFHCFGLSYLSEDACRRLNTLWQLRHSIVHTGGTLTLADSQKVCELTSLGEKQIVFEDNFIYEVARKLHKLVKEATENTETGFRARISSDIDPQIMRSINRLFEVKSTHNAWLR